MHLLKLVLNVQVCTRRAYTSPASWIFTELFNPEQYHMIAVAEGLKLFQGYSSMSWTASVICSTILIRTAIAAPLYTYTEKNQAGVTRAYCEAVEEMSKNAVRTNAGTVDRKLAPSFRTAFLIKCQADGCHPFKSAVFAMAQLPIWMTATFGLRNFCGLQVTSFVYWPPMIPEFITEGLINPTSSIALIIMIGLVNTLNVEIGHLRRIYNLSVSNSHQKVTKPASCIDSSGNSPDQIIAVIPLSLPWSIRLVHVVGLTSGLILSVVSLIAPSALAFFWFTSSSHQLLLNVIHLSPRVRSFLRIPVTPVDPKQPYLVLWLIAKRNYRLLRWLTKS